jgi:hypothetical protein
MNHLGFPGVDDKTYWPGLDEIDYIEARNPGIGVQYYSIFEKFPTDNSGMMFIFAKFKKDCINQVI